MIQKAIKSLLKPQTKGFNKVMKTTLLKQPVKLKKPVPKKDTKMGIPMPKNYGGKYLMA